MPKKKDETQEEVMSKKEQALDELIRKTIDAMSRNASIDFDNHQIAASIYRRMEKWALKNKIEDWDSRMPRYVSWVKKCSDERYNRVQAFMAQKQAQKQNKFSESIHDAINKSLSYGG